MITSLCQGWVNVIMSCDGQTVSRSRPKYTSSSNQTYIRLLQSRSQSKARGTGKSFPQVSEFTPRIILELASSTVLIFFLSFILGGIALYGNSRLQLRAVDDNDESWMKTAFSGFKIPLELAWLTFRVSLVSSSQRAGRPLSQ